MNHLFFLECNISKKAKKKDRVSVPRNIGRSIHDLSLL